MSTLQGMSDADLAALCECKHERAAHWDGTGQCGWCPCSAYTARRPVSATADPVGALDQLGAIWSDDFDAYAGGEIDAAKVHCALCMCAPCRCPEFGTPEYFALLDWRHGRQRPPGAASPPGADATRLR